ncbi:hypothetical protein [Jannaschia sp. R86511]|uniref:hypothetical protein n=1 Tax=Jannaschia sp. R86511 TaxID=3093853 RepID=UPI0036D3ABD6
MAPMMTAVATVAALGLVLLSAGWVAARCWRARERPADGPVAGWVLSLGISTILSFVMGLMMTAINVPVSAFPPAFVTSFALGVLVSTPTAYVVVPVVSRVVMSPPPRALAVSGGDG